LGSDYKYGEILSRQRIDLAYADIWHALRAVCNLSDKKNGPLLFQTSAVKNQLKRSNDGGEIPSIALPLVVSRCGD
jgi:hypothetical protein